MQNVLAVISLKNIIENARLFKERANKPLIAVVKDDAYGHGAEVVARALQDVADGFAVATADEGAALAVAGVQKDVLVLTPCLSEAEVVRIAEYGLVATISSVGALNLVIRTMKKHALTVRAHFAVNTGMNRYGFRPDRVRAACKRAQENGVAVEGVYTHLYAPERAKSRNAQLRLFAEAAQTVREYFPEAKRHAAATGGTLAGGELFDCVRIGIGLYGYLPEGFASDPIKEGLKPAMKLYASVAQNGTFLGGGVGYMAADKSYGKLHTLRLGYGDGFARAGKLGVGKLCMDACVREGRGEFGRRRLAVKDFSAYARALGTTEYEALVGAGRKAVKRYLE